MLVPKELESPIQAIREIGMKRLMGGVTAFGLVGHITKNHTNFDRYK